MPQGETFWHPYRLVPVRDQVVRRRPVTEEKIVGYNGSISCTLENLTLFFIGQNRQDRTSFLTRERRPVVPGSSLKGMLRSLAELVGGGCMVTAQSRSDQYKACDRVQALCVTCRLFGMMERGQGARVHRGQVAIGDGLLREENPQTVRCEVLLNTPKPSHVAFYLHPLTGQADNACRKLYFHQPQRRTQLLPVPEPIRQRAEPKVALLPGHHFDFIIQFNNLQEDELSLLLYVLVLEEDVQVTVGTGQDQYRLRGPLRHKLGLGKPLGMGSVHITVNSVTMLAPPAPGLPRLPAAGSSRGR